MIVVVLRNLLYLSFSRHIYYHVQPDPSVFCTRKLNSSLNQMYHHIPIVKMNFEQAVGKQAHLKGIFEIA